MFNEKQTQVLSYNLDDSRVKSREKAGMSFSYLETYDVINVANNIFNYAWEYHIKQLTQVASETNNNGNHVITYSAIVTVKIWDAQHKHFIEREDTGVGVGTAKNIGDAIDVASKSSVSDSLKRSLRSLGSQFGNNLYSKSPLRNNQPVSQVNPPRSGSSQPAPSNPQIQQQSPQSQHEFTSLYNLGLQVLEQGNNFVIVGEDIFNKKDSIKACGFFWDSSRKLWYMPKHSQEAA